MEWSTEIESNMHRQRHSAVMAELWALRAEGQMHERQTQGAQSQVDSVRHNIAALSTDMSRTTSDKGAVASMLGRNDTTNTSTAFLPETLLAVMPENQPTGNEAGYATQLYQIREDILQIVTKDANTDPNSSCSNSLLFKLNAFTRERDSCITRLKVLKSLYFPELRRRFTDITNAEANTLDWLYDRSQTSFPHWLDSQHGIYWINGLAGSGKSTLMKFAAENICTTLALKRWAGDLPLYVASHYFWHHGPSVQRSQIGLFRSLLYQILRATPWLITLVCTGSEILEFEDWDMADLKAAFDRLSQQTSLSAKFCFFVDGLDEYSGEERELTETLRLMTSSPHVKICASSRPWPEFAKAFGRDSLTLVVQNHTLDDMKTYVKRRLLDDPDFQNLRIHDSSCDEILPEIAKRAQGVWLWTFLVTYDLKRAVTRKEGAQTLRMILESFPRRLEDYFEHIISRVEPHFQKDMVRIFMMVVEAAQPLPLFVFRFLDDQDKDPAYAINATPESLGSWRDSTAYYFDCYIAEARRQLHLHRVETTQDEKPEEFMSEKERYFMRAKKVMKFLAEMEVWKARIHNRCSDLLRVTEDQDSELLLRFRVSFLHRTVADWLRENYATRMEQILGKTHSSFNTKRTLSYMMLMLLKTYPAPGVTNPSPELAYTDSVRANINDIIALTDELLCYVRQLEQTDNRLHEDDLMDLLDDLNATNSSKFDATNSRHLNFKDNHWTNVRDWPRGHGCDRYVEGGQCNFMALAVQCGLVRYVRNELKATVELSKKDDKPRLTRTIAGQPAPHERHAPWSLHKRGRPLLDYALRPKRVTPLDLPYHLQTVTSSVDPEMVRLLVDEGADPNARVHLNDGKTVFELFIMSCYEACRTYDRPRNELTQAWYRSACILVEHGARLNGASHSLNGGRVMTTEDMLVVIFGREMTSDLKDLSLAFVASRPGWGLWLLRGHEQLWDILRWIFFVFWGLLTSKSPRR